MATGPRVTIGYQNLIEETDTVMSASAENTGFPASFAKSPALFTKWKATANPVHLQADFGAGNFGFIELVAVIGHTMAVTGLTRVRTDNDSAMGSPTHDSGLVATIDDEHGIVPWKPPAGRDSIYLPGEDIYERYLRVDLQDASVENGTHEVGLLWAGPIWRPGIGVDTNWRQGAAYIGGKALRRWTLSWSFLTPEEADQLEYILHIKAGEGRLYVVVQDEEIVLRQLASMLCTGGEPTRSMGPDGYGTYAISATFTEADY